MNNGEVTYLIQQGNYLKIGYTSNLKNRLKQYNTCNADYKLLGVINGDYEVELQSKFKDLKYRDEWFHYSDSIIEQFNIYKESKIPVNNSKRNRNRYNKNIIKDIISAIKICNKHICLIDKTKKYITTKDPYLVRDIESNPFIRNKNRFITILLDNNIVTKTHRCCYSINDEIMQEAINNFENGNNI